MVSRMEGPDPSAGTRLRDGAFARDYEEAADRLCAELLGACEGASTWPEGLEAALARLLRFVAEEPSVARALIVDVKALRGRAWEKHREVTERLIDLLDSGRRQLGGRAGATRGTSGFVVGAIEESLSLEIAAGRAATAERLLPDLVRLALVQLFGDGSPVVHASERRPRRSRPR
jgi:hypothetical protein